MEVGVRVEAEDLTTGVITHCASAYLVFVALGDNGVPIKVPKLTPRTAQQRQWYDEAQARRAKRLAERQPAD
jgi:acyl-CoA hydrolase